MSLKRKLFSYFSKTYLKLLACIFIVLFFLFIIFSQIIFNSYQKNAYRLMDEYNNQLVAQLSSNVDDMMNTVFNFGINQYQNDDVNAVMNGTQEDNSTIIRLIQKLNRDIIYNSMVHGIYVYNNKRETVYSTYGWGQEETELKQMLFNSAQYPAYGLYPRRLSKEIYSNEDMVLTYFVYDLMDKRGYPDGAVIINVKMDWLFDSIATINPEMNCIVLDQNGSVLFDNHNQDTVMKPFNRSYSAEVEEMLNNRDNAKMSLRIDGEEKNVILSRLPQTNWVIVNEIPLSLYAKQVSSVRLLTILLALLFFGLAIGVSFFVLNRFYSPFGNLVRNVKQKIGVQDVGGDAKYLSEAFDVTLKKLDDYEDYQKSTSEIVHNNQLKSLIYGEKTDFENEKEFLRLPDTRILVILFSVAVGENNRKKADEVIGTILRPQLDLLADNEFAIMDAEHCVCLMDARLIEFSDAYTEFTDELMKIIKQIGKTAYILISVMIGKTAHNVSEIPSCYKNAKNLSRYRLIYGEGTVLDIQSVKRHEESTDIAYPAEEERKILEEIRMDRPDEAQHNFDRFARMISRCQIDNFTLHLIRLLFAINRETEQISTRNHIEIKIDFKTLERKILSDTLSFEGISKIFYCLFEEIVRQKTAGISAKKNSLSDEIAEYIQNNYQNKSLNIVALADEFKMSGAYLGRVFKKEMNCSIVDYLHNCRLEHAAELLVQTDFSIRKIMNQVGYENENYFYHLFKKKFGVITTQYRGRINN